MKHLQAQSNINHFIQAEIISRLAAADRPLRFSELKERGIENSLFMYHANKLIDRGIIAKTSEGFTLTVKGGRWANYAGVFHGFDVLTPRPLVQFIITDSNGNVLLARRKGQLRQILNDYLLPGNIYRHGFSMEENAAMILQELFEESSELSPELLTIADIRITSEDGFTNHVISHIFTLRVLGTTPSTKPHHLFGVEWVSKDSIVPSNQRYKKSPSLPELFARISNVKPHESFVSSE